MANLETRIDRLESLDAIRQLPAKYALALDMRDMDAMVSLFPEDVRVGRDSSGRLALRAYMDRTLRSPFSGTSHHIGGHIIEFDDADHAHGIVYSKNEHETGDEWVLMQMIMCETRVDGTLRGACRCIGTPPIKTSHQSDRERCVGPAQSG